MGLLTSSAPYKQGTAMAILRIITGAFLIYHGKEVFDALLMQEYSKWEAIQKFPFMAYAGKGSEFATGILLLLGLFTRITCLWIVATFLFIVFVIGHGQFWYDDQHPFMFAMMAAVFFFTGPGAWSVDEKIFKK